MTIQIDSREKARAIRKIVAEFDRAGVNHFSSKLYVGDYMSVDNPLLIIDRKQNLSELCVNVCQDHDRFRAELLRARKVGIQLVILIEHGPDIKTLEDVIFWENPRRFKQVDGERIETKATTGQTLYHILSTIRRKYGVRYEFCTKDETGKRIMEILNEEQ